jgi:methylated-DNA-[protein]-cysteine S-methyltransferase
VAVSWDGNALTRVELGPDPGPGVGDQAPPAIRDQFAAYFADGAFRFDLPLGLQGTDFQRQVWQLLRGIPAGATVTYGELAGQLGGSPRAVGGACRANPCPIVVPCHRVLAKDGPGGFAGGTGGRRLAVKLWLLRHEGVAVRPSGIARHRDPVPGGARVRSVVSPW